MGNDHKNPGYTESGTNIEEVKEQNAHSGLTYNEAKELLAKKAHETDIETIVTSEHGLMEKKH